MAGENSLRGFGPQPTIHDLSSPVDYRQYKLSNRTVGADKIFHAYRKALGHLVRIVEAYPENLGDAVAQVFPVDAYCQCQLGMNATSKVSCLHCTHIRRLMDYRYLAPDTVFLIPAGKQLGKPLIVTEEENVAQSVTVDNTLRLVILDNFSLKCLIQAYLYEKLREVKMCTILPFYTAFTCAGQGYQLLRDSQDLTSVLIDQRGCQEVLKQMATTISYLGKFGFHRRQTQLEDWRVLKQPIAYQYEGVIVNASFRVVLADFTECSIRINNWIMVDQTAAMLLQQERPEPLLLGRTFRLSPVAMDKYDYYSTLGQWKNGSLLWCSYLQDLLPALAAAGSVVQGLGIDGSAKNIWYQDLPTDALSMALATMSTW